MTQNLKYDLYKIEIICNNSRMIALQDLLIAYNTLISGNSTKLIKQTQSQLKELYDNPSFLPINKAILYEEQLPLTIKKMSAIHLGLFVRKNKKGNNVPIQAILQEFIQILCSEQVQTSLKPLFLQPLEELLSDQCNSNFRIALLTKLSGTLPENSINYKQYVYAGLILLGKKASTKDIKILITSTFLNFNILANQLHQKLSEVTDRSILINLLRLIGQYSGLIRQYIARIGLLDLQSSKLLYSQQLQKCITSALDLIVPGNTLASHFYFFLPQQKQITKLVNLIKHNYISCLSATLRILSGSTKQQSILAQNQIYVKSTQIISYAIQATGQLLQKHHYFTFTSDSLLVSCLFQTLGLLITSMRNNHYYDVIRANRKKIVEEILMPCLIFSPHQLEEFYDNQSQFVQKILQIVDKQIAIENKKRKKYENQQIEVFETLKTYAGQCLNLLCKYQDEMLTQIFQFTMNVLQGKVGCPFPKSVLLIILPLLKTRLNNRQEYQKRLSVFLTSIINDNQPPIIIEGHRKDEDIQYALILLSVALYAPDLCEVDQLLLPAAFLRGSAILSNTNSQNQVYKMLVFQLFDEVNRLQNGQDFAIDLIKLYNNLLKNPSLRLIESYEQLLEFNISFFTKNTALIMQGIFVICKAIEEQLKKAAPTSIFLNKCFNIVRLVGESPLYLPALIPELEKAVIPLIPYVDGKQGIDVQQDILLMLSAFLQHGKQVTVGQQQMFELIPKIFYSKYHCNFGQAFKTIHSFIFYGASLLANAPQAVQAIIEMSIASMNFKENARRQLSQMDNLEGVLILQSLALACGSFLTKETWLFIVNHLIAKLATPIKSAILFANIIGLLSLSLVHTQHHFTNEENQSILTTVLSGITRSLRVSWAQKTIIAGLCQLLSSIAEKPFIKVHFTSILLAISNLLEASLVKTSIKAAILQSLQEQDEEYYNLINETQNNLKILDQFVFFRTQFSKLHISYKQELLQAVEQLPNMQKDFLNRILSTQNIQSQPRAIFKIKRP